MKKGRKAVFGIFDSKINLEQAVSALKISGFRNSDISMLMPQGEHNQNIGHTKSTKSPEAATLGTGAGLALGGALGWLIGIGTVTINPLLAPFVAAGPIMSALAGAGLGGTVGGLSGALIGAGFPEYEAKKYESYVNDGGMLLAVHVDDSDWAYKAKDIMVSYGARSISLNNEESSHAREYEYPQSEYSGSSAMFP
jgi:hypothetical protein